MKKLLLITILATVTTTSASAYETTLKIGRFRSHYGNVSVSVVKGDKVHTARVFVSDKHIIDTVLFQLKKDELDRLIDLLQEASNQIEMK